MTASIDDIKASARAEARIARKQLASDGGARLAEALAEAACKLAARLKPDGVIAGYWPTGSEADLRLALVDLDRAGFDLALPVVTGRDAPLVFRRWAPGDALAPDLLGLAAPTEEAPEVTPALVFVPLLAFDVEGYRLGQGGGYYDRTLAAIGSGAISCGVGFSGQMVRAVPRDAHDHPLDHIITEQGVWDRFGACDHTHHGEHS